MQPEITAAIKKKAEEHVTKLRISSASVDKMRDIRAFNSYTCGGEEWVGFMLKFDEWLHLRYKPVEEDNYQGLYMERESPLNTLKTKAELLTKYLMEDNKL